MREDDHIEEPTASSVSRGSASSKDAAAQNAANAAQSVLDERRARLGPPKFVLCDEPNTISSDPNDPHSFLKILDTFSVSDNDAAEQLMLQLSKLEDKSVAGGDLGPANGALALVHALKPRDAVESMLASQMVGTHMLAMECMRRANYPEQTFAGRDVNLRHAERLMRIYSQQVDTLNKHRGKGQQKVTVEHVTVNEGGQAVVGNIESKDRNIEDS